RAGEDDDLVFSVERDLDRPGREEVLLVVEPAFPLRAMQNAPVPIGTAPHDCGWANLEMTANARAVDDPAVAGLRHVEAALPVPLLVVVAVGKERPELEGQRWAGHQAVGHHRPRDAVLHPDALFDDAAVNHPAEGGEHAVDVHALQQPEAIGINGPVPVLLSRERLALPRGGGPPLLERRPPS